MFSDEKRLSQMWIYERKIAVFNFAFAIYCILEFDSFVSHDILFYLFIYPFPKDISSIAFQRQWKRGSEKRKTEKDRREWQIDVRETHRVATSHKCPVKGREWTLIQLHALDLESNLWPFGAGTLL